jgi:lipopolysaccharide assembly outer membrane protein LptD (OstA)
LPGQYFRNNGPQLQDPATEPGRFGGGSSHLRSHRDLCDELNFNDKTVTASGNLLVTQQDTTPSGEQISVIRLNADRMEMDRETRLATFYHAYGTARIVNEPGPRRCSARQEPDIMFYADKIERLGPKKYKLTHGAFTTCLQPNPRWQMIGGSGTVELGDHATMTNVRFMVKDIPCCMCPYIYYPLTKNDRKSGFLIPSYSTSGVKGNGISTAYFQTLGKSQDATLFYDYYTKAGQGAAAEYRFVSAPEAGGNVQFHSFFEKEQLRADELLNGQGARRTTSRPRPANPWAAGSSSSAIPTTSATSRSSSAISRTCRPPPINAGTSTWKSPDRSSWALRRAMRRR